jgi:hypothetical protein
MRIGVGSDLFGIEKRDHYRPEILARNIATRARTSVEKTPLRLRPLPEPDSPTVGQFFVAYATKNCQAFATQVVR